MYRVIIVDDEPWTVQSITETLPWAKYNMQIIGSFSKASEALNAILSEKPDVVFTDIRMPVISGIQLMQILRNRNYDTEVVVISGYDQFDYVRDSLRLGAFDYCLKPLNEAYVSNLLSSLKEKLDQKAKEKNNRILDALTNDLSGDSDNSVYSQIPSEFFGYQVMCINGNKDNASMLSKVSVTTPFLRFDAGRYHYYLINTDKNIPCENICESGLLQRDVCIGFSRFGFGLRAISQLIQEATIASHVQFITEKANWSLYCEPRIALLLSGVKRLESVLLQESENKPSLFMQEAESFIVGNALTIEELCIFANQLILQNAQKQSGEFSSDAILSDWHDLINRFQSAEEYICHLSGILMNTVSSLTEASSASSKGSTIGKMIAYLNENYTRQVHLKDLADMFYINKNYASLLFRRHTGMNYSDYLNSLRLNKARELLAETPLSINEVAEQSGYPDYFYFNKLFKKTFGITPAKFRKTTSK